MNAGARAVDAARGAIGARFRLHGRDPATGLDCVGLAALALNVEVPRGYALRCDNVAYVAGVIEAAGLVSVTDVRVGDLLLLRAGPGQLHFAIQTEDGMIHADAMLRRVVERRELGWPVIGRWRTGD